MIDLISGSGGCGELCTPLKCHQCERRRGWGGGEGRGPDLPHELMMKALLFMWPVFTILST